MVTPSIRIIKSNSMCAFADDYNIDGQVKGGTAGHDDYGTPLASGLNVSTVNV
jgi:hypothetical protein